MDFVVSVWSAFAMRALGLAIAYLILAAGSALGTPAYLDVSVADLVHDPAVYAGKQVRVHGFLIVAFEGDSVWVDEAAYKSGLYEQGFWVDTRSLKADEVKDLLGDWPMSLAHSTFNTGVIWVSGRARSRTSRSFNAILKTR